MIKSYIIIRAVILSLLALVVAVPIALYVLLSTDWAQARLKSVGEEQLTQLLGTKVSVGYFKFHPFNRVVIGDVIIEDDYNYEAVKVDELGAGIDMTRLLLDKKIVIDFARIEGLDAQLYKKTPDTPLNIANIIEHLQGKDKTKPHTKFDLKLNMVVVRDSKISYDIKSLPTKGETRFDVNHMAISDLDIDAHLARIKNDDFDIELSTLKFNEKSGVSLKNLSTHVLFTDKSLAVKDLTVELPSSHIEVGDLLAEYQTKDELKQYGRAIPVDFQLKQGSYVTPSDLKAFAPFLSELNTPVNVNIELSGVADDLNIKKFEVLDEAKSFNIDIKGEVFNLTKTDDIKAEQLQFLLQANGPQVARLISSNFNQVSDKVVNLINKSGDILFTGELNGSQQEASFLGGLSIAPGNVNLDVDYARPSKNSPIQLTGEVKTSGFDLSTFLPDSRLGKLVAQIGFDTQIKDKKANGSINTDIAELTYRDYTYKDIKSTLQLDDDLATLALDLNDDFGSIQLDAEALLDKADPSLKLDVDLRHLFPEKLNLIDKYPGYWLAGKLSADISGKNLDCIDGYVYLDNFSFINEEGDGLLLHHFDVESTRDNTERRIDVTSDFLNGSVTGEYSFTTLPLTFKDILSHVFPAYFDKAEHRGIDNLENNLHQNNFTFDFTFSNAENLGDFLNIPVKVIYPVSITGGLDNYSHKMECTVDAPYLQQGDKIIENTVLHLNVDGEEDSGLLYATTQMPTKKGNMSLVLNSNGADNRIDTNLDWMIERAIPINGSINFSTLLDRDEDSDFRAIIDFNPGEITFGETVWSILTSRIIYSKKDIDLQNFALATPTQYIRINGVASSNPDDKLVVDLRNVNLIEIFETLEIDKAMIGGQATGTFYASNLFSKTPNILTDNLHVDNISYNRTVIGDADITSHWDNDNEAFVLDAKIAQQFGRKSHIYGSITPAEEALDIYFEADHVNVGFMKPFMDAFTSDISGEASGTAHLFGTFKYIDLEGDITADDLKIKIDFTNSYYTAKNERIHLSPGLISLKDVTIYDQYGHTAKLNGRVEHTFFKAPVFDFAVTDARNFLSYDTTAKNNPIWYGRIFGNGSAFINGKPGVVNIDVNMTTAPQSVFTFVISDMEEASEYSFITFRNREITEIVDSITEVDDIPLVVKEYQSRVASEQEDEPSLYNMKIQVDVTPEAQMILVMDPIGGDRIKANGSGNLRLTYESGNEDLKMYGTYTLDKGSYNFTLQDIIIKDFTIKPGSSIAFHGDPYSAQLDIQAVYSVNANLSDLDESFLQDKDLNRTNVPVHALLMAQGDMRQPDISFDLEFPTLTQDTYRKVRSIVSTEEMMNRQIIYLLALNRFYTPDYMTTTKGNELFSVASSTIASQLSSMLGQLSENWSIAPNLRSDRGDFSDVEVDVALSSTLLNNRLLFNGNFGYRDKSLNTNQFVGDFDIEYLLNRRGTWRLKAYNRYNDQNYYVRTAQTTQGVGLVFKRDFDRMFRFFVPKKKDDEQGDTVPAQQQEPAAVTNEQSNDWLMIQPSSRE
jgi:hypothetical protein